MNPVEMFTRWLLEWLLWVGFIYVVIRELFRNGD